EAFNAAAARQTAIVPISEDESTPEKVLEEPEKPAPPDESSFHEISDAIDAFLKIKDRTPDSVAGMLNRLAAWNGSDGQDAVDVFGEKISLYLRLYRALRPFHSSIVEGWIAALDNDAMAHSAPLDWVARVTGLPQSFGPEKVPPETREI